MTRSMTAAPPASADRGVRPSSRRRPVRYADAVGRVVVGGQPAVRCAARPSARQRGRTSAITSRRSDAAPARSTAHGGAVGRSADAATGRALRLTRRGQALVVLLVALVLSVAFSLGRVSSDAANGSGPPPARPVVVVQPGESLWQIAERAAPDADPRVTVARIAEINDLGLNPVIRPGQQLVLP